MPWKVSCAFNVEDQFTEDYVGSFSGATFLQGRFAIHGHSTHMSLRLRSGGPGSDDAGPQTLSNMVVHYQTSESG